MDDQQRATAERFERMFQSNHLPWRDHPIEPLFTEFFDRLALDSPSAKIFDIGCGDGWASIYAAEKGFHAWGLDSSPTAIQMAKKAASEAKLEKSTNFTVGDALASLAYEPGFFDAVIDGGLFHHILPENREKYIKNIVHVLKPRGYFYLSAFSKSTGNDVGFHFSKEEIETIFDKWFQTLEWAEDEENPSAFFRTLHFIMQRRAVAFSEIS